MNKKIRNFCNFGKISKGPPCKFFKTLNGLTNFVITNIQHFFNFSNVGIHYSLYRQLTYIKIYLLRAKIFNLVNCSLRPLCLTADTFLAVLAALCVCGLYSLAANVGDFVALIYFKLVFTAYAGGVCDK